MAVLYVLLPVTLLVVLAAVGVFVWAVRSGQFDDLETPQHRVLLEDDPPRESSDSGHPGPSTAAGAAADHGGVGGADQG